MYATQYFKPFKPHCVEDTSCMTVQDLVIVQHDLCDLILSVHFPAFKCVMYDCKKNKRVLTANGSGCQLVPKWQGTHFL